jgi:hypothetical protein
VLKERWRPSVSHIESIFRLRVPAPPPPSLLITYLTYRVERKFGGGAGRREKSIKVVIANGELNKLYNII